MIGIRHRTTLRYTFRHTILGVGPRRSTLSCTTSTHTLLEYVRDLSRAACGIRGNSKPSASREVGLCTQTLQNWRCQLVLPSEDTDVTSEFSLMMVLSV